MSESYEETDSFTDKAGQTVKVGDTIVYATCQSHAASLTIGKVLKIQRYSWKSRVGDTYYQWRITVRGENRVQDSRIEYPNRTVKLRSAEEVEFSTHPVRTITFGKAAYDD
jgi:hypothetical protein